MRQVEFQIPVTAPANRFSRSTQPQEGSTDNERNDKSFSVIVEETEVKHASLDGLKVVEIDKDKTSFLENEIENAINETSSIPPETISQDAKAKATNHDTHFIRPEHQNLAIEDLKRHMIMARQGNMDKHVPRQIVPMPSNSANAKEAMQRVPVDMALTETKAKTTGKNTNVDLDLSLPTLGPETAKSKRSAPTEAAAAQKFRPLDGEPVNSQSVRQSKTVPLELRDQLKNPNLGIIEAGKRQPSNHRNAKVSAQVSAHVSAQTDAKVSADLDVRSKFNFQTENTVLNRKSSLHPALNVSKSANEGAHSLPPQSIKANDTAVANSRLPSGEKLLESTQLDDAKQPIRIISVTQSTQNLPNVLSQIPEKVGQLVSQELTSLKQDMASAAQIEFNERRPTSKITKSLTIQLKPENLGTISVKMLLVGKKIEVTIMAESSGVANRLNADISNLRLQIQVAGLRPDELSISVKESDFGAFGKDPSDSDSSRSFERDNHKHGKNLNYETGDGSSQGTSRNDRHGFDIETQKEDESEGDMLASNGSRNGDKYI